MGWGWVKQLDVFLQMDKKLGAAPRDEALRCECQVMGKKVSYIDQLPDKFNRRNVMWLLPNL